MSFRRKSALAWEDFKEGWRSIYGASFALGEACSAAFILLLSSVLVGALLGLVGAVAFSIFSTVAL